MIQDFRDEFQRYRRTTEKALEQIPDEMLHHSPVADGNSAAVLVRHVGGNLRSRFTDFLTADGEKPWRERDREFEEPDADRAGLERIWAEGWEVLEGQLAALTDADLARTVTIRGQPLSVHAALARSIAHVAYHAGQMVLLARMLCADDWRWISIPRGESQAYNQAPTKEKQP